LLKFSPGTLGEDAFSAIDLFPGRRFLFFSWDCSFPCWTVRSRFSSSFSVRRTTEEMIMQLSHPENPSEAFDYSRHSLMRTFPRRRETRRPKKRREGKPIARDPFSPGPFLSLRGEPFRVFPTAFPLLPIILLLPVTLSIAAEDPMFFFWRPLFFSNVFWGDRAVASMYFSLVLRVRPENRIRAPFPLLLIVLFFFASVWFFFALPCSGFSPCAMPYVLVEIRMSDGPSLSRL